MNSLPMVLIVDGDGETTDQIASVADALGFAVKQFVAPDEFFDQAMFPEKGCVVADLSLKAMDVCAVHDALRSRHRSLPVLYTVREPSVCAVVYAMRNGACNVLEKPLDRESLAEALRSAVEASQHAQQASEEQHKLRLRLAALTPREREVLALVRLGMTSREIAAQLGRSTKTVELHRTHILRKLRVRNVVSLVRDLTVIDEGYLNGSPDHDARLRHAGACASRTSLHLVADIRNRVKGKACGADG